MASKESESKPVAASKPPQAPSSSRWKHIVVVIAVAMVAVGFNAFYPWREERFLGLNIPQRKSWNELNALEQQRWNVSVKFSFPNAQPIPSVRYNYMDSDFVDKIMEQATPVMFRKFDEILQWPASSKWTPDYVSKAMPTIFVHAPTNPVIRLHQMDDTHPFSDLPVNWTRPWIEEEVYADVFFKGDKLMYYFSPLKHIPLGHDVDVNAFTVPWSSPMEVNLWMGTPTITTPAHYDMVHNFYAQVKGYKRWILFPPEDANYLYTFTALHPSARQSQVNFNDPDNLKIFPDFAKVHPYEVILGPGDVLFIPPFWFHYVTAVGDTISMSVSTHTESQEAKVRERLMGRSEALFRQFREKWPLATRVNALVKYLGSLFQSDEECLTFMQDLIAAHWSHFQHDHEVIGLTELVEKAFSKFPTKEQLDANPLTPEFAKKFDLGAKEMRKHLFGQLKPGVKEIMIQNHVEEIASYVIGPLNVKPLLTHIVDVKQQVNTA